MRPDGQDGYATPAAAVISFAIAIVVATLTVRGIAELRLAKAELTGAQIDYALAAAQNAAMAAIATSSRPPPYRWTVPSQGDVAAVVAEPERPKLSFTAAAMTLGDESLVFLGGRDLPELRRRLGSEVAADHLVWTADQSGLERWRDCAPSYVSPYGAASQLPALVYGQPEPAQQPGLWRAGEVWRIQVTLPSGWRDERIVRFTGSGVSPAAVLGRRLSRVGKGHQTCETLPEDTAGA